MVKLFIDKEFIGAVIGPQGKIIQEIQRETGTTINLEEVGNFGEVSVFSPAKEGLDKAVAWIKGIVAQPEVGSVYEAKVKSVMPYGAFVEFLPGKQGLLHISEVSHKRLETLEGVLKEGDPVKVKLIGLDQKTGKFKLSRKVLIAKPEGAGARPQDSRSNNLFIIIRSVAYATDLFYLLINMHLQITIPAADVSVQEILIARLGDQGYDGFLQESSHLDAYIRKINLMPMSWKNSWPGGNCPIAARRCPKRIGM